MTYAAAPALVVPVDLAALVVGSPDADDLAHPDSASTKNFAKLAAAFDTLPYRTSGGGAANGDKAFRSDHVLPNPFDNVNDYLEPGIHLHWALPDALTRGTIDNNGELRFHQVPDRWLVVRVAGTGGADASARLTAWVIESDHRWDDPASDPLVQNRMSRPVPKKAGRDERPNRSFTFMGRVFPYGDWTGAPGGEPREPLTALGYGIPGYAATYAHCQNVFGMHDPMTDEGAAAIGPDTSVSYLLVGWYSERGKDPLAGITAGTPADRIAAIDASFRWILDWKPGDPVPSRLVCHGLVTGLRWDRKKKWLQQQSAASIDVVLAESPGEAVSALLQKRNPDLVGLETLLNLFQQGLLGRLGQIGGAAAGEEAIHQTGFGSVTGGTLWIIRRPPPPTGGSLNPNRPEMPGILETAAGGEALPPALAVRLDGLNALQRELDAETDYLDALRQQIFNDWCKFAMREYEADVPGLPPSGNPNADGAREYIDQVMLPACRKTETRIQELRGKVNDEAGRLQADIGGKFQLVPGAGVRYWQPADPVILLADKKTAATSAPPRHGGDGRFHPSGKLVCRRADQIVRTLQIGGRTVAAPALLPGAAPGAPFPAEAVDLVAEAFTLDPARARVMARAFVTGNPAAAPPGGIDALAARIAEAQKKAWTETPPADAPVSFPGRIPSQVGLNTWEQPWIPLYLQWEVYFQPYRQAGITDGGRLSYGSDAVTGMFELPDDGIDFVRRQGVQPVGQSQVFSGSMLLAGRTDLALKSQIDTVIAAITDPNDPLLPTLKKIREQLDLRAMAQALTGFNDALLMRKRVLQVPVFDPIAESDFVADFSNKDVAGAVRQGNLTAPTPHGWFNSLRSGILKIARLRLVDAFGQILDIKESSGITVAQSLRLGPSGEEAVRALLPPRITQPSRLQFRLLPAAPPGRSPICGWLLFNRLDSYLMIYNTDGSPIGSLNTLATTGTIWQGAPGSPDWNKPIDEALRGKNPFLARVVKAIHDHPRKVAFLRSLLDTIDRATASIAPEGQAADPGLGLLVARPLALVRTTLRLELQGPPALDQGWNAFAQAIEDQQQPGPPRFTAGMETVHFPVRLGEAGLLDDGMVGYFVEDGTAAGWQTFHSAYSTAATAANGIVPVDLSKTSLTPQPAVGASGTVTMSMLVDPRGTISATSGILPVKTLAIPRDQWEPAMDRLAVTFLTAPMVGGGRVMPVPIPEQTGLAWSWMTRKPDATGWTGDPPGPAVVTATIESPQRIEEGWLRLAGKK